MAWFDRDRDGRRDGGEWALPGVTVELTEAAPLGARDGLAAGSTPARRTVTGADGSYRFADVAPGRWVVTAVVDAAGFAYTSDTDGALDWSVVVDFAAGETAVASFAGVGTGELDGTVFSSTTRAPIGDADVRCRWSGFDDVAGTGDDLVLTVRSARDGSFGLAGIAYGGYSCTAVDPVTGRTSAPAEAEVMSVTPVRADLPIVPASPVVPPATPAPTASPAPVPQAAPVRPVPVRGATVAVGPQALARTGTETWSVLLLAGTLLLAGGAATVLSRRPRARSAGQE